MTKISKASQPSWHIYPLNTLFRYVGKRHISTVGKSYSVTFSDNGQEYIGDRFVNESVQTAIKEVNNAFDNTLAELYDKERTRSPSDLLTIFRLPTPSALAVTRAAEIFERTLENVLRAVAAGDKYNVTHSGL